MTIRTITTISSINENPACRGLVLSPVPISPIPDVRLLAFAALDVVGAARPQVKTRWVPRARPAILIFIAPRIGPQHLDVWPAPLAFFAGGRLEQHFQSFFRGRMPVHVNVESFQSRLELSDGRLGRADFRFTRG